MNSEKEMICENTEHCPLHQYPVGKCGHATKHTTMDGCNGNGRGDCPACVPHTEKVEGEDGGKYDELSKLLRPYCFDISGTKAVDIILAWHTAELSAQEERIKGEAVKIYETMFNRIYKIEIHKELNWKRRNEAIAQINNIGKVK